MSIFHRIKKTQDSDLIIYNYLKHLYAYLGDAYCFLSGAFIIQDNDSLFEHLQNTNNKKKRSKILQSHTTYFQGTENPHPELAFYETILNNKLVVNCSCPDKEEPDTRVIQSIKWYKFIDNDISLIYLKPESSPTITTRHVLEALSRYAIGNPNKSCRIPRREDCHKDKTGCIFIGNEAETSKNYNAILYKREGETDYSRELIQDSYNRKGDEVFIPSTINTYILNNIVNSNIFDYDQNDIILVNPISITGGKNRMYKRTCKNKKGTKTNKSKKMLRKKSMKNKKKIFN